MGLLLSNPLDSIGTGANENASTLDAIPHGNSLPVATVMKLTDAYKYLRSIFSAQSVLCDESLLHLMRSLADGKIAYKGFFEDVTGCFRYACGS